MLIDSLLTFLPSGAVQSLVAAAGATTQIGNPIDILGSGVGTAPANIIGNATVFGEDTGVGSYKPLIELVIGVAAVTGNAATLTIAFQGAPDTGAAGGYQPGTWQTLSATGALTAAQLTALQDIRMDWPVSFPDNLDPRYLRLVAITPAGTNFTAGTISQAIVTNARDDQANKFQPRNFNV